MTAISVIHAPTDEAVGEKIAEALMREGHDATTISGDPLTGDLNLDLDDKTAIVIWSRAAQKLARIREQAREALTRGALIPVAIGGAEPPREFKELPPVDLSGWRGDGDDPRWRFVLEEIDLAGQRSLLADGAVWAGGEEPTAAAPAMEEAAEVAMDEVPAAAPPPEPAEPVQDALDPAVFAAPAIDPPGDEPRFDETQFMPAPAEAASAHKAGFHPRHVMMAAGLALMAVTAAGALLAPVIFKPPIRTAQAPLVETPAGEDRPDDVPAPATLAFVKPANEEAPPTDKLPWAAVEDAAPGVNETRSSFPLERIESPAGQGAGEAASPAADLNETANATSTAGVSDQAEDPAETGSLDNAAEDSAALDDAGLAPATPSAADAIDAPADDPSADLFATALLTGPAEQEAPVHSDSDAMENLVAAVTAETEDQEMVLAKLETLPEDITEKVYLGNYFKECVVCPDMAALPAGAFRMGSPASEPARHDSEGPTLNIVFARPFAISTREVTFEQWDACVDEGGCRAYAPPAPWGRGKMPVVNVSFEDAQSYVEWLSQKTGRKYRLPSEAEWEYAARAGTMTPLAFGDRLAPNEANYAAQYPYRGAKGQPIGHAVKVASYPPNAYGLFDMHGNVWEWTADCWAPNHANAAADGSPRLGNCSARVLKGGAFNTGGWRLRSAHRISKNAKARENDNGFRVARDLD